MPTTGTTQEPKPNIASRRIVLTTFGSLGDLYPYIALAKRLQDRGHEAVIATTRLYQQRIEASGVGFHAVRPEGPDLEADHEVMRRVMDPHKGSEYVIRELLMPALHESYQDILAAAEGGHLLVSHVLTYATRLAAEKTGIPWASSHLQPLGFFSAYDPPVLPQMPFLSRLRFLGPAFHRLFFGMAKRSCRSWAEPWRRLRAEIHLPPSTENPLFEGQNSPSLVLAIFSRLLADKQPDWPPQTVVTGFPFPDPNDEAQMPPELLRFLDAGPPPIVFTLGSSAILDAGPFYQQGAASAKMLGRRAVLIVGKEPGNQPVPLPEGVAAFDYAPFSKLFPRAAAVVHPGGIGTTALAMRYGRPMLVIPYAHDQFDNAVRVTRLGIARTISRRRCSPTRIAAELGRLLNNPVYSQQASGIAERLRQEDGVRIACDALEKLLYTSRPAKVIGKLG